MLRCFFSASAADFSKTGTKTGCTTVHLSYVITKKRNKLWRYFSLLCNRIKSSLVFLSEHFYQSQWTSLFSQVQWESHFLNVTTCRQTCFNTVNKWWFQQYRSHRQKQVWLLQCKYTFSSLWNCFLGVSETEHWSLSYVYHFFNLYSCYCTVYSQ